MALNESQPVETGPSDPAEIMNRLFPRRRIRLIVETDLDPVPGWGNDPNDWVRHLQQHLNNAAGHYHPTVEFDGEVDR